MTENCWYADIVLPDKTYLESWHFAPTRGTPDTGHNAIRQPMTNPYNLEWDAFGILWEISKRLDMRDKFAEECNKSWGLKEVTFKPGRDYTQREGVEIIWADKTKKDFSVAVEHGFVGSKKTAKAKYLGGRRGQVQGSRQGQDQALRRPVDRHLLQGRGHREEEQSREDRPAQVQDRVLAAAEQGSCVPDAAPRGDRLSRST